MKRTGARSTLRALVALILGLFLVLGVAAPAIALPITVGGGSTGGGDPTGDPGTGPVGSGGSSGGSGGSGAVVDIRYGTAINYYWFPRGDVVPSVLGGRANGYQTDVPRIYYNNKCGGSSAYGPYLGVKTIENYKIQNRANDGGQSGLDAGVSWLVLLSGSYTCIDPPHYRDTQVICAYAIGADGYGPYNNPQVPATKFYSVPPQPTPFVTGGERDLNACRSAYVANFSADVNIYGRYRMIATGYRVACTYRVYTSPNALTGAWPANRFIGCGGSYPFTVRESRLQLFCPAPGYSFDWSGNWDFTPNDCIKTNDLRWSCGPSQTTNPTYDGMAGPRVEVLDDGKNRLAQWRAPTPTGVQNVRGQYMQLRWLSGTPYRQGQSANGSRQPFVVSPGVGSNVTNWKGVSSAAGMSGWNINFQEAGYPNKPWTAQPRWYFTGDFPVIAVTVTQINVLTGQLTVTTHTEYVSANAYCEAPPLQVDVVRARTSN